MRTNSKSKLLFESKFLSTFKALKAMSRSLGKIIAGSGYFIGQDSSIQYFQNVHSIRRYVDLPHAIDKKKTKQKYITSRDDTKARAETRRYGSVDDEFHRRDGKIPFAITLLGAILFSVVFWALLILVLRNG